MTQPLVTALLWFGAIGCGLMAGVYFAFSTFVMTALARLPQATGIAAMNAINADIVRSLFLPLFFGTTLAAAALAVIGALLWGEPGATAMAAGGAIYVLGMFVVTIARNVPLNNALAPADPESAAAAELWATYVRDWTWWNHVRTVASTVACGMFIAGLVAG
ncbi:anthrone oxygenase family protein [Rhodopseudomonas palustris]|uniref:anthrone oxygenase family protein n=1 Tax=Rhodopseudomonas palustris TaxID=1076 RepID=UPI002ACD83AA|nr:anthrone oxygenase family protein [Rhodopseudomonas palustris]WQH00461.1 anthrone oxygenase family protein [Rhodopseudomonas palustris]